MSLDMNEKKKKKKVKHVRRFSNKVRIQKQNSDMHDSAHPLSFSIHVDCFKHSDASTTSLLQACLPSRNNQQVTRIMQLPTYVLSNPQNVDVDVDADADAEAIPNTQHKNLAPAKEILSLKTEPYGASRFYRPHDSLPPLNGPWNATWAQT